MTRRPRGYGSGGSRRSVREFWELRSAGTRPEEILEGSSKAGALSPGASSRIVEQRRLFVSSVLFQFSTEGLSNSERVRFFYGLKGRGQNRGLVEDCDGVHLGPGVVILPPQHAPTLEEFLVRFDAAFRRQDIWVLQPSRKARIRQAFERRSVR